MEKASSSTRRHRNSKRKRKQSADGIEEKSACDKESHSDEGSASDKDSVSDVGSASDKDSAAEGKETNNVEEKERKRGNNSVEVQPDNVQPIAASLKKIIDSIKKQQNNLQREVRRAEQFVYSLENSPGTSRLSNNALINLKLSDHAAYAISTSSGPLTPEKLTEFLMERAFSKPRPSVLAVVREFTENVEGLQKQLAEIRDSIDDAHNTYKENQRRLSENLNQRIRKLLGK